MFDAYHKWLGIPPEEQPPDHYRLLGIAPFESDPAVIAAAADRQMAYLRTLQAGTQAEAARRLLNEVARARVCLLDPARKAAYDAELQAGDDMASALRPVMAPTPDSASLPAPLSVHALPGLSARRWPSARRSQNLAIRRLVTVASSVIAAAACAWLLGRHSGVFRPQERARQAAPLDQNAAGSRHRRFPPAVAPQEAKRGVPTARAAGLPAQRSPLKSLPATPPPAAPPRQAEPLPEAPSPQREPFSAPPGPKPAGPAPPGSNGQPGGNLPRPAPGFAAAATEIDSHVAPGEQPVPKVSALAPPGAVPIEPPKPPAPPSANGRQVAEMFETAMTLVAQGRYPVGYQKLHEALKADRHRFDVLFALGLLEAVVAHEWDDAEKHFAQCAKLEPKSLAVLNNLALVRLRTNKAGLTIRHWEALLEAASPPPDEVIQNIARTWLLARNRRLILSPENARALAVLARKVDAPARANQVTVFHYLPPDGEPGKGFRWPSPPGLTEDWCMSCLGYGTVKCPACVRGAVRSPATRVLGADRPSGTIVTQTGTVRSRCTRCGGTGWVDCPGCEKGHQR